MIVEAQFDKNTFTLTYIVFDETTKDAIIIDPVLDYEPVSNAISYESSQKILSFVEAKELKVHYIIETHVHADHMSAAFCLKEKLHAKTAIGVRVKEVQEKFKDILKMSELKTDGTQFDLLLKDGDVLRAGSFSFKILSVPGHTPADIALEIDNMLFTGDALFMPDFGTGRCDFPNGSAEDSFDSIMNKLYQYPDSTKVFVGHDYMPGGRELLFETSIGESKAKNIRLNEKTNKDDFVKNRNERDERLESPKLLLPSLRVNLMAGRNKPTSL